MPNWAFNTAIISHEDPAMIQKFVAGIKEANTFNCLVPMPEELRNTTSPSPTNEELVKKYGASDWYSWSVENWGTKWDVEPTEYNVEDDGKSVYVFFDSAWSPPIAFYEAIGELGFKVDATYTEESMAFAGHFTTEDGDNYVDLDFDKDSQEWIDEIEDTELKMIVQNEYDNWLSWHEDEDDDEEEPEGD